MGEVSIDGIGDMADRQRAKRDPDGVRSNILAVAMSEFAENGLSGARIDEIAAKTRTSKRMIYYYYGDKEGLYLQVLEASYRKVREGEKHLELDHLDPAEALARLVRFTFDHHRSNPDFIRIVMIENIHHGQFLRQSDVIRTLNQTAIDRLASLLDRGKRAGLFRTEIQPLDLHWQISALSFFNVSNRATFSGNFGDRLWTEQGQNELAANVAQMILRYVLLPELIADYFDNTRSGGPHA